MKNKLEIAIHESGHSVFRLITFGTAGRVAVFTEPVGNACGVSCGKDADPERAAREVTDNEADYSHLAGNLQGCLDAAGLAMAGAAAVDLWRGTAHLLPDCGHGNQKDTAHVYEVGRLAFLENDGLLIDSFRRLAYRHACAVLGRRMPAVKAIAERLAEVGTLEENEIGALYAGAITEKKETEVQQ